MCVSVSFITGNGAGHCRQWSRGDFGRRCEQRDAMDVVVSERLDNDSCGYGGRQLWWWGEVLFR